MKKYVFAQILGLLICFDTIAYSVEAVNYKVQFQPIRIGNQNNVISADIATLLEPSPNEAQKKQIGLGLGTILSDLEKSLDKEKVDVEFDNASLNFKVSLKKSANTASKQIGFSSCISSWLESQTKDTKVKFAEIISPNSSSSQDDVKEIRTSIATYFNGQVKNCYKGNLEINFLEFIQPTTNEYVEKKSSGLFVNGLAENMPRVYDEAYQIFNIESDKDLQKYLLDCTAKYFNSFEKNSINQNANIDAFVQHINEKKPLNSASLFALTMGGLVEKSVINDAFEAIQLSQKTPEIFGRSLVWINHLAGLCSKELFSDPKGKECSSKLYSIKFYWLEFNRSGNEFKFLITQ